MTDTEILRPLVDELIGRAAESRQAEGAELFAALNSLEPVPRAPVATVHELIPGEHWPLMLGEDSLRCRAADARALEWRLQRDLWADEHIGDDRPLFAHLVVQAAVHPLKGWGVQPQRRSLGGATTAWRDDPPFGGGIDLGKLTYPEHEHDAEETGRRLERLSELTEGRLPIHVQPPHLGHHPFDVAVSMRGMDNLLMDCALDADAAHGLMAFVTEGLRRNHLWRESEGLYNGVPSPCGRYCTLDWAFFHCARWPDGTAPLPLTQEWAYVSGQTSAGLGPAKYAEFVQPYNERLAELHGEGRVYYHGCDCLDEKFETIANLPGVRRIHVSPWSSVGKARRVFGRDVVLEVHAHPTAVFFTHDRAAIRAEIEALLEQAGDARLDLNLNDIHSIAGNPCRLGEWTAIAREASDRAGPR
ncbi:MAG: hypothetical protein GF320_08025 [Armatimonadia bacterium]|nr:hypothetical protein [Armatimonadia bacterium]